MATQYEHGPGCTLGVNGQCDDCKRRYPVRQTSRRPVNVDYDWGNVDLGAAHNGRVEKRKVFEGENGRRFIVDGGRRVDVLLFNPRKGAHINWVIKPTQERS